jgi:hypothetical protein
MREYTGLQALSDMPPHIFGLADLAFTNMVNNLQSRPNQVKLPSRVCSLARSIRRSPRAIFHPLNRHVRINHSHPHTSCTVPSRLRVQTTHTHTLLLRTISLVHSSCSHSHPHPLAPSHLARAFRCASSAESQGLAKQRTPSCF